MQSSLQLASLLFFCTLPVYGILLVESTRFPILSAAGSLLFFKRMADMVPISVRSIPAYAGGFRRASAEVAVGIERATTLLHKETKGKLPIIYRVFMSDTCRQCDFAAKCLPRSVMDASEFAVS